MKPIQIYEHSWYQTVNETATLIIMPQEIEREFQYLCVCYSIKVYPGTLEHVEEFGGLTDFLDTFALVRGKKKKRPDDDDEEVGEFKVR